MFCALQKAKSPTCKCGLHEAETAEHLLLRCRYLTEQREILSRAVGARLTMKMLVERHAAKTADWAICCFGLGGFKFARDHFHRLFPELLLGGRDVFTRRLD